MPTITLQNTVDAWVAPDRAGKFGDTRLYVHSLANAYVYFARPSLPQNSIINSATLYIYPGQQSGSGASTVNVNRLTSSFDPNTITWTTQPTVSTLHTDTGADWYNGGLPYEVAVTTTIQNVIDGGAWYGFRISSTAADSTQWINSGQSILPMKLVIDYSAPPPAPTNLYPSANAVVNDPKPTLQWVTPGGAFSEQLSFQVQVASDSGFTTGLYTLNETSSAASSIDLDVAAPTFTALTNGQSRYWRVRVKNTMGLWSPYSAAAQFTYNTALIVNITAPSGNVNNMTPTVTWTYGGTQVAYQVQLWGPENGVGPLPRLFYDSGILYGSTLSHVLPIGAVEYANVQFTTYVRVWNTGTIVSVTGVPAYNEDSQTFTWVPSGATPPVDLLITARSAPYPPRMVRWQYTGAAASSFIIERWRNNTREQMWQLTSAQTREGVTNWYNMTDWIVPGRADVTYYVRTVLSTGASSTNIQLTIKMDHLVCWVQSPYNDARVFCLVNYDVDPGLSEITDVVKPIGGAPYLAVQSFGKYNGTVKGEISGDAFPGYPALTGDAMKANYLWMRQNPRAWLTWADESIECFIYGTTIVPFATADGKTSYYVSFNFVQV